MQRRTFLGAAAAVASLPPVVGDEEPDPEEYIEEYRQKDDYEDIDCGSVPGSLSNVHIGADMVDDPLSVTAYREEDLRGVGLRWIAGPIEVGTGLEPDDARELAARLRVAAAFAEGDLEDVGGGEGGA